jgi:acylglycerol lipase
MEFPPESYKVLEDKGIPSSQIEEYYHWLEKLRKKIHPSINLAPNPNEFFLKADDGAKIFVQEFLPEKVQAILICQHGNGIQSDLFYPLADFLVSKEIGLIAVDNRGHGRSEPKSDKFDKPGEMMAIYEKLILKNKKHPIFLLGESLGCTMLARFFQSQSAVLKYVRAIIFQVPPLKLPYHHIFKKIKPLLKPILILGQSLTMGFPFLIAKPGFDKTYFTEFHRIDRVDPIRASKISIRHLYTAANLIFRFPSRLKFIDVPILILEGTGDNVVDPSGAIELFKNLKQVPRKLIMYKNANHSLYNDINSQRVYEDIYRWITRWLKQKPIQDSRNIERIRVRDLKKGYYFSIDDV